MQKHIIYRYLGTNGIIETPVHLEGIYYVRLFDLRASDGKILTNGIEKKYSIIIPEEEFELWKEIDDVKGQN